MSQTVPPAVTKLDQLLDELAREIDEEMSRPAGPNRSIVGMLGREADGYLALRELLTGERRPSAAH